MGRGVRQQEGEPHPWPARGELLMYPPAGEHAEPERAMINRRRVLVGGTALAWTAPVVMTTRPNPALAGTPADGPEDEVEPEDEPRDEVEPENEGEPENEVEPDDDFRDDDAGETNESREPDRPDQEVGPKVEPETIDSVELPEPDRQPEVEMEPAAGEEPTPITNVEERVVERTSGEAGGGVRKALADTGLHAGWLSATGAAALTVGTVAMRAARRREARSAAAGDAAAQPAGPLAPTTTFPAPPDRPDDTDG